MVQYTKNMLEVLLDASIDALKIFPFIFAIYVLMEAIEHARNKESIERVLSGPFAPVFAGALGAVPECGFAVMCAKLYDKGLIKTGTIIAAFLSVSDEGIIILISEGESALKIFLLLFAKTAYAVAAGIAINALFSKKDDTHACPERDNCIECGEKHEKVLDKYFLHPLKHALTTFAYVLVINFALSTAMYFIGEGKITDFMDKSAVLQPAVASVIGLIPNCGSSIILAKAYCTGILGLAGLFAGLSANAGIGALILFKDKRNLKKGFKIVGITFLLALIAGYLAYFATAVI